MYLMYVDECGDKGMGEGASRYFILSGLVVHESQWTDFMNEASQSVAAVYRQYGIGRHLEIHAKAMLGRSEKGYSGIPKVHRVLALRDLLRAEAALRRCVRIISIVVDKRGKGTGYDPFTKAWDALINRFENTIRHGNFPIIKQNTVLAYPEHGLIITDKTDENALRRLIREMRWNNLVPSAYGTRSYQSNLIWVIEDALHKQSEHSLPIQLCDVNAYFLRQLIEPNSTIRKHDAQNYFYFLEPVLLKEACQKNALGIVFL